MSRCKSCEGKGFIESWHGAGGSFTPSLEQCPKRCDIGAYSRAVQQRLNNPNHVTERPVLQQVHTVKAAPRDSATPPAIARMTVVALTPQEGPQTEFLQQRQTSQSMAGRQGAARRSGSSSNH